MTPLGVQTCTSDLASLSWQFPLEKGSLRLPLSITSSSSQCLPPIIPSGGM